MVELVSKLSVHLSGIEKGRIQEDLRLLPEVFGLVDISASAKVSDVRIMPANPGILSTYFEEVRKEE